jgi:murein DD-endopeptidase MepM/ murein hydrolase activator NlpD
MPVSPSTRIAVRVASLSGVALLLAGFLLGPLPAHAASDAPLDADASLSSPVIPFRAVHLFDRPDTPWGSGHRGIDIEASVGQEVLSPAEGVVTFSGTVVDRGVVSVRHGNGLVSSVEPVVPSVLEGQSVTAGEPLGTVSDVRGHCAPRTCLHWGVRQGGEYLNPLDVLKGFGRVRLLPLAT